MATNNIIELATELKGHLITLTILSTLSSSWTFEALVPVLIVDADVFICGRIAFMVGEQRSEIQRRILRTKAWNLKIQDDEDVDVLGRPA